MDITQIIQSTRKYGITERKKAELDLLTNEVLDAQHEVEQYQAMVTSLTEKNNEYLEYLAEAEATRDHTRANVDLLDQLIQDVTSLKDNSNIAFDEMVLADDKIKDVSKGIKEVMDELIYSAEVINKLSNIIIKKKAKNPLISDELIDLVNTIGKDANDAVALTLVGLQSTYAAEATSVESEAASALEYRQAIQLYEVLRGRKESAEGPGMKDTSTYKQCLENLVKKAYKKAKKDYNTERKASKEVTDQLNQVTIKFNKAQVNLSSLQAGLAAANAAALAS
ncbi:MAG: hypothetical protein K0U54_11255 [Bacteroidetes bacterium]|nr:hypothetical protein [Bacteroidota bacterium]